MKKAGSVLGVTGRTVAFHKYRLTEAFRLKTNSDLYQLAVKHNLAFHRHALDSFSSFCRLI